MGYSRFLSQYPLIIILVVVVVSTACLIVTFIAGTLPDFSNPKVGFETSGTKISGTYLQWYLLADKTGLDHSNLLSVSPRPTTIQPGPRATWQYDRNTENNTDVTDLVERGYFCGNPGSGYPRIVFKSRTSANLFDYKHILSMCSLEQTLLNRQPSYGSKCIKQTDDGPSGPCCRRWSLGNYIAMLNQKKNCSEINEADVKRVGRLLKSCAIYYANSTLLETCFDNNGKDLCQKVPQDCKEKNAVVQIFRYIVDSEFISSLASNSPHLTHSVTFLPFPASSASIALYREFDKVRPWRDNLTEITAVDFDIKFIIFDEFLQEDTVWLCVALAAVFVLLWIYTSSFCVTCMSIVVMALSLWLAYFIYSFIFNINFFPFMNLLAAVVIIGIGADDICIYIKAWSLAKSEKKGKTLEKIISTTMKHAALSMFVTSFTTASAFYAGYISNITTLKCFSLYTGTVVLVNFLLMVTWIPAVVVIHTKCSLNCCQCYYGPEFYQSKDNVFRYVFEVPCKVVHNLSEYSRIFFEKLLPCFVIKLRFFWLALLVTLSAISLILTFYHPKLKLPSSETLQVFSSDHPFEVYDMEVRKKFDFEKEKEEYTGIPLTFVWGVLPIDNRDVLNPASSGELKLDPSFDMADPRSQAWLQKFCRSLRRFRLYKNTFNFELTNCFIEHFRRFMASPCSSEIGKPCCRNKHFPYSSETFTKCINVWMPKVVDSKFYHYYAGLNPGLRFTTDGQSRIAALIVQFFSNQTFSFSHQDMDLFYKEVNQFLSSQMHSAPPGMRNGWFNSGLKFYDLQEHLLHGTPLAMVIAISIATVVLFVTTLNVLITIYAVITIVLTLSTTVGVLVLLGWQLNILESVTLSVAVGLSIDFTLHYGMSYRLSPDLDRENRIISSISRTGSSVTMAAFTTFVAGMLMLPSTVLAYRQLGTFLMVIMSTSWLYATFLFQTLLRFGGPEGGFGQFHWPASKCCSKKYHHHKRKDKTRYTPSDSTCSTSSFSANPQSSASVESQELELLPADDKNVREQNQSVKADERAPINNNARYDSLERKDLIVSFQRDFRTCAVAQPKKLSLDDKQNNTGLYPCDFKNNKMKTPELVAVKGANTIPIIHVSQDDDDIWILKQDLKT